MNTLALAAFLILGSKLATLPTKVEVQPPGRSTEYVVVSLGSVNSARAIGQGGTAAGGQDIHAWAWGSGRMAQIEPLTPNNEISVNDVNAAGAAAGWSFGTIGGVHSQYAVIWDAVDGTRVLEASEGWSAANGINDQGHVVGYRIPNWPPVHVPFVYRPGDGFITLPKLASGYSADPWRVNNLDLVIGTATDASQVQHPVMWTSDGSIVDLGTRPGRYDSHPMGINDSGFICGYDYGTYEGTYQTLSWIRRPDGQFIDLFCPYDARWGIEVFAINSHNLCAGWMNLADGVAWGGFTWSEQDGFTVINEHLAPGSSRQWNVRQINGINDAGQMSANVYRVGQTNPNAVVVEPVLDLPVQPSAFSIFRGRYLSGNLQSLQNLDGNALSVQPGMVLSSQEAPVQVVVDGVAPASWLAYVRFDVTAHVSTSGLAQKLELYDWTANRWEVQDTRPATTYDSTVEVYPDNPARFVQVGSNLMRARISYSTSGPVLFWPWAASIDQVLWKVTP